VGTREKPQVYKVTKGDRRLYIFLQDMVKLLRKKKVPVETGTNQQYADMRWSNFRFLRVPPNPFMVAQ
jgi:hypothetical protein